MAPIVIALYLTVCGLIVYIVGIAISFVYGVIVTEIRRCKDEDTN